jgi:hypothetical protein
MRKRIVKFIIVMTGLIGLGWLAIYFRPIFIAEPELTEADTAVTAPVISVVPIAPIVSTTTLLVPATTPTAVQTPPAEKKASSTSFIIPVPFTAQAPLGEWSDARQQDGCEEASVAMAMAWVNGENNITKEEWLARLLAIADFEQDKYGENRDVALEDVVGWIFKDYYGYNKVLIKTVASSSDILRELERGNVVLIPTNGQALKNPNFKVPGPEEHMILIKGYDYKTGQFIANDPGTRRGENYHYSSEIIFKAIRSYETGYKLPFPQTLAREMIVVEK